MSEELTNRYGFHLARTEEERAAHETIRKLFKDTAMYLEYHLPEGREKSLAHTALQEASMWANAALAPNRPLED